MNILSINKFYWQKGGAETVFLGEKALLEQHKHQVVPFSMQSSHNLPSEYAEYFVTENDYSNPGSLGNQIRMGINIIYSFEARQKIEQMLNVYHPDIAHVHNLYHQISPSVFAPLKKRNIPIVLTLHDLKLLCPAYSSLKENKICEKCYGQKFYHCTLNKCTKDSYSKSLINTIEMYLHHGLGFFKNVDRFIAVSHFYRNKLIANGFSEQQVCYLPNFIEPANYPLSFENNGSIVYFGRLSPEKGVGTLLKAAEYCPDSKFIIVGTGPMEQQLKQDAQLLKNVEFVGFQSGQALLDLIKNALCTVLPSICYENCPLSILESQAMGKPVIGSRIGGIPELIDEGKDGLTFEIGNAEDLANKIAILKNYTAQQLKEMVYYARNKIEQRFSSAQHYEKLMQIYREII
ncbi:hypothetical protein BCS42_05785 [Crenothrix sp. D3]|nr:hypothetical protein BCS42_05785 [Crenothrix sp. D3]